MSNKKKNIIVLILAIIAVLTLGVGILKSNSSKEISKDDFKNLISKEYRIVDFERKDSKMDIIVAGDLTSDEIKDLSKNIFTLGKDKKAKEKSIEIKYIDEESKVNDEFYFDGLKNKTTIDLKKESIVISSYKNILADKGESLKEFSDQEIISAMENNLNININMDLSNLEDKEILTELKTYSDLVIKTNLDKDIISIQVNAKSNNLEYGYSSKFNNILKISEGI